jgi:hypothetical protein
MIEYSITILPPNITILPMRTTKTFKIKPKSPTNSQTAKIMESAIKPKEKLLYISVANDAVTTVCATVAGLLVIRHCSAETETSVTTTFTNFGKAAAGIELAFVEGADGFLVYANPL